MNLLSLPLPVAPHKYFPSSADADARKIALLIEQEAASNPAIRPVAAFTRKHDKSREIFHSSTCLLSSTPLDLLPY